MTELPEGYPLLAAGGQKIVTFGNPTFFGRAAAMQSIINSASRL